MSTIDFTLSATVATSYDATVARVRELLGDAGFGVLTEIDLRATLLAKLGVEVPAQVILGACRPQLAHRALQADPRIATLLPCNVVVTEIDPQHSRVEVFDPAFMATIAPDPELGVVAADARARLTGMMDALTTDAGERHAAGA
ncbi:MULTISPECIES: DUF302 domain-containing protein [unclassified Nocardioides]|uniref:DUF302 domain-containing protein n=1 Tax=unclassified Nocardioides TaxID=2615069 RepID=UPI0006F69666|nr:MULTISPECIES: DUF302 domain-containing protein [unclassified Nocardioides]KRA37617.1 ABC transporter [Nocardioides sp. Root614]KRA91578.1 ABC transporter [Nocardioides sp. Root682]